MRQGIGEEEEMSQDEFISHRFDVGLFP